MVAQTSPGLTPRQSDDGDRLLLVEELAGLGSFVWFVGEDRAVWSDSLCRMMKFPPGSMHLSFATFLEGIHPEDRDRVGERVGAAFRGEAPYEFECRVLRADGEIVWAYVHARVDFDESGQPARVFGVAQDVTERKAAQRALRESEESYRAVFEGSSDAIYVLDRESGAILDVNPAACALNGYPPEEMKALGIEGLTSPDGPYTWEDARALIARAAAGETQRVEWLARHPEGHDVWGEVTLQRVTIRGEDRVLATARDITDRKRAEAARAEAEYAARSMAERMRAVAGAASGLIGARSVDRLQEVLLAACRAVIPFDTFAMGLYDEEANTLTYPAGFDAEVWVPAATLSAAGTPAERVIRSRRSLVTRQADAPEAAGAHLIGTGQWSESVIRSPILGGDRVLGVLSVQSYTPGLYDDADVEVLEALASLAATALLNLDLLAERVAAEEALRLANEELERRVAARTADLEHANAALEEEMASKEAATAELARREEHFRRLIEHSSDVIAIVDPQGIIRYESQAVQRLFGYDPRETVGTSAWDRIHPDDVETVREAWGHAFDRPEEPSAVRFRLRSTGGEYRQVEAVGQALADPTDGAVVSLRDVSDRVRAEEALRDSEARYRSLIENAHDIVTVLDLEGRVVYGSPQLQRVLGYAPSEMIGRKALDFVHPDDLDMPARSLEEILARPGSTVSSEYRFRHRDGSWRYMETFGRTLLPESAEQGLVFNSRDVTERREAQALLEAREEHFRQLIETSHDLVQTLDPMGRIVYTGPSVQRLLGYTPEEITGGGAETFIHPDDRPRIQAELYRAITHPGEIIHVEYRVQHKDGSWRWFEALGRTLSPDGPEQGLIANARDITERRLAQEALGLAKEEAERAREAAERANRAKSEFLSRMSHELRTPMNSILGFAQLLDRAGLPPEHRKGVGHILRAGRHLLQLINEVLEIARIESGGYHLSLEPVRVSTVVREAVGLVRPLASQWRVDLHEPRPGGDDLFVSADRQRLAQVLLNLLSNAIKYNRPGGAVRIEWDLEEEGGREHVVVRVHDAGRGIPAERQDQLFTPFARLGAEQSEVEGTGLGLALSQRLTEAMGGALRLERTGPAGSVFRVDLAQAEDPLLRLEDAPHRPDAVTGVPHPPATLLYIEDNLANLSLVETILLSRPNWRTLPALQGQIGVELAQEHRPDLILLDLHLPDISGEEVLRRLRANPRTSGIPVIVITADATRGTVERLRSAGADAYLTKPLDIDDFLGTIERLLPSP
jgi:PAS domain S-box-containing protein